MWTVVVFPVDPVTPMMSSLRIPTNRSLHTRLAMLIQAPARAMNSTVLMLLSSSVSRHAEAPCASSRRFTRAAFSLSLIVSFCALLYSGQKFTISEVSTLTTKCAHFFGR